MTMSAWPQGVLTPLVTPLAADRPNLEALKQLVEFQVQAGVKGVVVGGGSGEFGALSVDERQLLAAEVASVLEGRLPLIVQAGALATRDSIALSVHAEEVGAAGILLASPFGESINWRERRRFYEQINADVSIPIMVYNTPAAGLLSMTEVQELADLSNVNAIKDSSGDVTFLGDLLTWSQSRDFAVYVGWDNLITYGAQNGARGALVGTANLIPEEIVRSLQRCWAGDADGLAATWPALRAFLRFMEDASNYVALCKVGLTHSGIDVGEVRAPYLMPDAEDRLALIEQLRAVRQTFASADDRLPAGANHERAGG